MMAVEEVVHAPYNNSSLWHVLNHSYPDFVAVVPDRWLEAAGPSPVLNLTVAAIFLVLCLVNNVCSILLFVVFARYVGKSV